MTKVAFLFVDFYGELARFDVKTPQRHGNPIAKRRWLNECVPTMNDWDRTAAFSNDEGRGDEIGRAHV